MEQPVSKETTNQLIESKFEISITNVFKDMREGIRNVKQKQAQILSNKLDGHPECED